MGVLPILKKFSRYKYGSAFLFFLFVHLPTYNYYNLLQQSTNCQKMDTFKAQQQLNETFEKEAKLATSQDVLPEGEQCFPSFDSMNLKEPLLRGIFGYV